MDIQTIQTIKKLIPILSVEQENQLQKLGIIFEEENQKVNLISRKDIDFFFLHHVLHSLSVCFFLSFSPKQTILDIGTGGGLPGIPLAILFPHAHFTLIDSIQKKISAATSIVEKIGIANVELLCSRAENVCENTYDSIISRAVASASTLAQWAKPLLNKKSPYASKGLILLKGGAGIHEEIRICKAKFRLYEIGSILQELPYYQEKYLLHADVLP